MTIRVDLQAGIGTIWLARPKKHNAFDGEMLEAIEAAISELATDDRCRVVVLAGEGRSFCAGADLAWMARQADKGPEANLASAVYMGGVFHQLSSCAKPTIARVHGAAMGGGVGLASACDFVVTTERAFFAFSEVRLGLVPGVISPFVVRRIGPARARTLFMLGDRVSGRDAREYGLADVCVESDEDHTGIDEAIAALISRLVKGGPQALFACKELVDGVQYRDPAEVLAFSAQAISERRAGVEAREGMAAFLEKRAAAWIPSVEDTNQNRPSAQDGGAA